MAAKPFESKIQDLVYNVDVGIGLRLIKFGLYLLFILFIMLMYTATQFRGLDNEEAMDYAQLGRNLMSHKKMVTQCIRPASLWYMIDHSPQHKPMLDQHPDLLHPPLYPALLAAGFKLTGADYTPGAGAGVFPPEQWVVVPLGHVFTLLTGILVFLMGNRLFDRRVGMLGTLIYFLSDLVWRTSISGKPLTLVTFWVMLAFYTIVVASCREREGASWKRWLFPYLVSAVACVMAFLTRYGAIVVVPGLLLYVGLSFKKKRWILIAVFLAIFLVGIAPWLARNIKLVGNPLGLALHTALLDTRAFPEDTFMRSLAPSFEAGGIVTALQAKWMALVETYYKVNLRLLGDGILICLFITTFFYRFVRRHVHLFRWSLAFSILLLILLAGFFGDSTMELFVMFWPVVLLYGLAFFYLLLDRLQLGLRLLNIAVTSALVLLCALPLIFSLMPPRAGIPYPPYFPPFIVHVSAMLEPDELMCTDMPWATAWYGNRTSLQLPVTLDEFYTVNDYTKRISGLYLTTITRNKPYVSSLLTGEYRSWFPIMGGRLPADFPLTQGFPLKEMDQLFLTDRKRWEEQ